MLHKTKITGFLPNEEKAAEAPDCSSTLIGKHRRCFYLLPKEKRRE
jgi:hypothetical protein